MIIFIVCYLSYLIVSGSLKRVRSEFHLINIKLIKQKTLFRGMGGGEIYYIYNTFLETNLNIE